jgi:hypothetical protein
MSQMNLPGRNRAGDSIRDLCRACKTVRNHTVIAVDNEGRALRVICDYCQSQHNFRGGERQETLAQPLAASSASPLPLVTERERSAPALDVNATAPHIPDLELLLRRIIREETGLTPVPIAEKWRGGEMVLRPARPGLQEKVWPIETFFHKVVILRNRLRVLEQQINAAEIPEELKVRLQAYITGCYGTLTSFNVLFADEADRFQGASGVE